MDSSPPPSPSVAISRRKAGSPDRGSGSARKNSGSKDFGTSILNSVNKSTSQFKKAMHRRSRSPINWFPRKKTDSYLKRKIKHLQEVDGMNLSLDETLENANPHYTRMAREKIAAREAARKAMEARKDAMVEASWCRILQAARIQKKEAEAALEEAKRCATEAFEAARTMGVMMYDRPDCPRQQCEVESLSSAGGRSTHAVTASFETAFEVDKEVAAAVKKAFIRLASFPSSSDKEEFKELLRKISQNPDTSESGLACEAASETADSKDEKTKDWNTIEEIYRSSNTTEAQQSMELVDTMLERLKGLHEDELASLAVIVATCGLNAALLETDRGRSDDIEPINSLTAGSLGSNSRRYSSAASFMDLQGPKKEAVTELPGLDKVLVKHPSRLEREVHEAREASRKASIALSGSNEKTAERASDLGSILVKRVSKLEKEILEARKNNRSNQDVKEDVQASNAQTEPNTVASVDVPHCDLKRNSKGSGEDSQHVQPCSPDCAKEDKENKNLNSHQLPPIAAKVHRANRRLTRVEAAKLEALKAFCSQDGNAQDVGLDKVLVKPVHRLEKEKTKALEQVRTHVQNTKRKQGDNSTASERLDQILVKHFSRLELEKAEFANKADAITAKKNDAQGKDGAGGLGDSNRRITRYETARLETLRAFSSQDSLDKVLIKPVHRLEKEKMKASEERRTNVQNDHRKRCDNAMASESLDQILVKHVSRLEREKSEFAKKGDVTITVKKNEMQTKDGQGGGLGDILVKHPTKHEQPKLEAAAAEQSTDELNPVERRRRAREQELLDAWGGLGLGNSMKPHLSKIEKDKAAWRRAEEEQQHKRATREP